MTAADEDRSAPPHELRSFGRRRGRKPSPHQQRLLDDLLPRVGIDLSTPPPADTSELFATALPSPLRVGVRGGGLLTGSGSLGLTRTVPITETWLEIGFGGAEHLIWQAEHNPHVGIIGCEPFEDGVVKALAAIEDKGLENVRLHADDARPLLRWLPEASIARAFVLFPDPWPKKRHAKRRLVSGPLLDLLARVLRPGAELRIGTDIGDYARTMLIAFAAEPRFQWLAQAPEDWRIRPDDWPGTRYEAKAWREGRRCYYLRFLRV